MRLIKNYIFVLLFCTQAYAYDFDLVALGVKGGFDDANLSSWLVKPVKSSDYVSLDSGTLVNGLKKAFGDKFNQVLTHQIPCYLISHAHFDHYMGMVLAQPELRQHQTIMAQEKTMEALISHAFNWSVWGNFGDEGNEPRLGFQHYQAIPLLQWQSIPGTEMEVKAYPLSHGHDYPSTAFLIRHHQSYLLYFGDTGADRIEKSQNLQQVWNDIAPLVRQKQLRVILLECSYHNAQPLNQLFGHLKPSLYFEELEHLAKTIDPASPQSALKGLNVIVTHIKPDARTEDSSVLIMNELREKNTLGVELISPEQGKHYRF